MGVAAFHRTLEQELAALARGVSLECLVCGEFVLHEAASIRCPECGATIRAAVESAGTQLQFGLQAG
jgi:rubrerythrin